MRWNEPIIFEPRLGWARAQRYEPRLSMSLSNMPSSLDSWLLVCSHIMNLRESKHRKTLEDFGPRPAWALDFLTVSLAFCPALRAQDKARSTSRVGERPWLKNGFKPKMFFRPKVWIDFWNFLWREDMWRFERGWQMVFSSSGPCFPDFCFVYGQAAKSPQRNSQQVFLTYCFFSSPFWL